MDFAGPTTYAFQGDLQALDHMHVSANLLSASGLVYDLVHANSEFTDQVSDHAPILMSMAFVPAPVPEPATWLTMALGVVGLLVRTAEGSGANAGGAAR